MKMFKFIYYWKIFTVIFFILICLNLIYLSKEVIYRGLNPSDNFTGFFEIDLCYRTNIENDYCHSLENENKKTVSKQKIEFNCNFKDLIACHTKDFRNLTASKIIEKFQECNISDWALVKNRTDVAQKIDIRYSLYNGYICVNYRFKIKKSKKRPDFIIKHNQTNQAFDIHITYSIVYKSDGEYRTKKSHLFPRTCWNENKSNKCSETDKKIVFKLEYFSAKHLEYPFNTNCVYRKGPNSTHRTQNDCYENCIKKKRNFHRLTYHKDDNFKLDYNKSSSLRSLIEQCSASCSHEDCQATGFFIFAAYEGFSKEESEKSSIVIKLQHKDFRAEALPLFETSKLVWMLSAFVSIFFGTNFYGLFLKSTNLNNFADVLRKRKKRKSKKLFEISLVVTLISLCLSLVLEKVFFDFGNKNNMILRKKESIKERDVSVSICFDLCKIIKDEFKSKYDMCDDTKLYEKSLKELNEITWNVSDFRSRASMRSSARQYPIRQNDYEIRYFFRNFKKCFLLYYKAKNYWTHLPLQRSSQIHINITQVRYAYFFIEDGHNLPKISAHKIQKSVLHCIDIYTKKPRDGCIDYQNYDKNPSIKSKNDLIENCVIEKYRNKFKSLPIWVNVKFEGYRSPYKDMKFKNDSEFSFQRLLEECENIYKKSECNYIKTHPTHSEIFEGSDNISINLTPFIYETKPLGDENSLIVLNRVFSYLIIFTGFSVREFMNAISIIYFFTFFSPYNFQLVKRLLYLALFLLFLINFAFLFHNIIYHPMLETAFNQFVYEIESSFLRICFEMDIDLNTKKLTVKYLEANTPNMSEILKNILIYDDENELTANLTFVDFELDLKSGNHRYSKRSDLFVDYIDLKTFYLDNLKCFIFHFPSEKIIKNLKTNFQRFYKLYSVSLKNFDQKKLRKDRVFFFMNAPNQFDFDYNKAIKLSEYLVETTVVKSHYQDDYWYFKNFFTFLTDLVGISESLKKIDVYLRKLRDCFMKEQYATTTLIPLYLNEGKDFKIKNRQFNFYMQFRSMVTNKNDYDFTRNAEKTFFSKAYFEKGSSSKSDELTITVGTNLLKFQEISRNRFRYAELFVHLSVLISFWFRVDIFSLPISLKDAYPFFRYFIIYFLYYIALFLIYLFELWFSFVRFLRMKSDE